MDHDGEHPEPAGVTIRALRRTDLAALRIERVRTEVGWNEQELVGFLGRAGFAPVPRLVLERAV